MMRRIFIMIVILLTSATALAAENADLKVSVSKPGANVKIDRVVDDCTVVISVFDAGENPIFGLSTGDFTVTGSGRTANILSVLPASESLDVPRNIVLVLDNSYSMKERKAISSLLAGVSELLKIVRPIDQVQIVAFDNFKKVNMDGYDLSVRTFKSNQPAELNKFAANAYSEGLTGKTVLYDALLAGLSLISKMPEKEPKFLVVFSDGEDLNSTYGSKEVLSVAQKLKGFNAYAIDFTPDWSINGFLSDFAGQNRGHAWKAKTENSLVAIFQEVASKMQYYYVVRYQFPPTGNLAVAPSALKFDEIKISDAAPETKVDISALTLRPVVDSVYGVAKWKVAVSNSKGKVADLAGDGAPASELKVQLPAADLQALAAGGDLAVKMQLEDKKGQVLALDTQPVKVEVVKTRAGMTVAPSTLKFEEVRISDGAPETKIDSSALTLRPVVDSVYGIARWKVAVTNSRGSVADLAGEGAPAPELRVALPASDLKALAAGGDLAVRMQLEDKKGQVLVMNAPVKVEVVKTSAGLTVAPSVLKFDEVRVSDAAPDTKADASALTLRPSVSSVYGIAKWKVSVSNAKGIVADLAGEGAPAQELKVPLPAAGLGALAAGGDLAVRMQLEDKKGQVLAVNAPPVKVEVIKTSARLAVAPASLTIEEIRTIDASPMLSHIYFDKGSSEIPAQYIRLAGPEQAGAFDEQKFRDALEKYYQVLNIVGKRLTANPGATITLVGCNDNTGEEKGNKKLSARRAEAVRDYLQTVWNIAPERMSIEARNLPAMPSAIRMKEGQAENRRVEIRSAEPEIVAPIQSTYFSNRIDSTVITLKPEVVSPYGIASWKATASNAAGNQAELAGEGAPAQEIRIPLDGWDLAKMSTGGDIAVKMELRDNKGQTLRLSPGPVKVNFIQTSQRLAQKEGLRVQEKYALILFDFDKEKIEATNQEIINKIVSRARTLPQATINIVGHSDNTGKEEYNIKLSERRALAVYNLLKAAYEEDPGDRIRYSGVGPNSPLYDNMTPEARSFNRTVTITLEYLSAE